MKGWSGYGMERKGRGRKGGAELEVSRNSRIKKYYQLSCSGLTRTSKCLFELEFVDS